MDAERKRRERVDGAEVIELDGYVLAFSNQRDPALKGVMVEREPEDPGVMRSPRPLPAGGYPWCMENVPRLVWAYVAVVAAIVAVALGLFDTQIRIVPAVIGVLVVVGVVKGARWAWLLAMLFHASTVLLLVLGAVWPWEGGLWALVGLNLAAVVLLLTPSLRLDRSINERAPRGAC